MSIDKDTINEVRDALIQMNQPQAVSESYTPGRGYGKDMQDKADKFNSLGTSDQNTINKIEKVLGKQLRDLNKRTAYFDSYDIKLNSSDLKKLGSLVKNFRFDNEYDDLWIECDF